MEDLSRRVIAGRYRLVEEIGRGGMGLVWRAYDETLRRDVAVKELVFPPGLSGSDLTDLRTRAIREAQAAARLDHPAIIGIYDVVLEEDHPWIVMQIVRGRSLYETVADDGPLPHRRATEVGLRLLEGLAVAHGQGVLHRDVTPRNVLLADDGRVILTDFGIAAVADATAALTQTGALIGSPGYVAPERLTGEQAGTASDLWSLGATLYYALEGRHAYQGTVAEVVAAIMTRDPEPAHHAGALRPVLEGLLARHVADRLTPETARSLLTDSSATVPVTPDRIATDRVAPITFEPAAMATPAKGSRPLPTVPLAPAATARANLRTATPPYRRTEVPPIAIGAGVVPIALAIGSFSTGFPPEMLVFGIIGWLAAGGATFSVSLPLLRRMAGGALRTFGVVWASTIPGTVAGMIVFGLTAGSTDGSFGFPPPGMLALAAGLGAFAGLFGGAAAAAVVRLSARRGTTTGR